MDTIKKWLMWCCTNKRSASGLVLAQGVVLIVLLYLATRQDWISAIIDMVKWAVEELFPVTLQQPLRSVATSWYVISTLANLMTVIFAFLLLLCNKDKGTGGRADIFVGVMFGVAFIISAISVSGVFRGLDLVKLSMLLYALYIITDLRGISIAKKTPAGALTHNSAKYALTLWFLDLPGLVFTIIVLWILGPSGGSRDFSAGVMAAGLVFSSLIFAIAQGYALWLDYKPSLAAPARAVTLPASNP